MRPAALWRFLHWIVLWKPGHLLSFPRSMVHIEADGQEAWSFHKHSKSAFINDTLMWEIASHFALEHLNISLLIMQSSDFRCYAIATSPLIDCQLLDVWARRSLWSTCMMSKLLYTNQTAIWWWLIGAYRNGRRPSCRQDWQAFLDLLVGDRNPRSVKGLGTEQPLSKFLVTITVQLGNSAYDLDRTRFGILSKDYWLGTRGSQQTSRHFTIAKLFT